MSRTTQRLIELTVGLPLIAAPLLLTATSSAYADPGPGVDPCATVVVPEGFTCLPEPKQCITTPCPQYTIVPLTTNPANPPTGPAVLPR
ncbi:hypothetical protein OG906_01915 [Streptomyces sp. NBC_01426]|uniref:hypothetical protein n=1 Tax=unclassified Streptomyces TaxID=2593676 RepID=UPI002E36684A|nr:hypothetical protein [Streptomyces sp. NBC_01426]